NGEEWRMYEGLTRQSSECVRREQMERGETLAPDYTLLIEQIVDYFYTLAHLSLGLFRHWKDGTNDFAWFNIVQRRDAVGESLFEVLPVACHVPPFIPSFRFRLAQPGPPRLMHEVYY